MSIRAINWAIDLGDRKEVSPTMRHVLLILANFSSEDDLSYPRQNTIARITGLSRPWVNQTLQKLEAAGLITATGRTHDTGATRSSEYKLHIPDEKEIDPRDTKEGVKLPNTRGVKQVDRGVNDNDSGCKAGLQGGVNDVDTLNLPLEPPEEPSHKPRKRTEPWPVDYFDQFYSLTRKKTDKKDVRIKLARLEREDRVEFQAIIEGLRRYNASVRDRETKFTMSPLVFLNGERWEDELEPVPPTNRPEPRRRAAI